ncbi:hypothetical protein [Ruegeria atlantica]|uniref:hypothetical protein n=1 Tax=Ruegeria atlantica TaxID=81569 RepID=UPI001480024C|nr:hypothetical protein [Ruegeria atlantica]
MREIEISVSSGNHKFMVSTPNGKDTVFDYEPARVDKCLLELSESVSRVAVHAHEWEDPIDNPASREVLIKLASAGTELFDALTERLPYGATGDVADFRELVKEQIRIAEVMKPGYLCIIPWEMIYLGDQPGEPQTNSFIGSWAIVKRRMHSAANRDTEDWSVCGTAQRSFAAGLSWKVGRKEDECLTLIEDNYLPSASNHSEKGIFDEFGVRYDLVDPVDSAEAALVEINSKTQKSYLSHFNCHGARAEDTRGEGKIKVSNNAIVGHVKLKEVQFQPTSTVMLNVCHACQIDVPYQSIIGAFASKEIGAVVGPMHKIDDAQSTEFARYFYEALYLDGQAVGEALLRARKKSLLKDGNPAALLYTLYGDEKLKLPPLEQKRLGA